MKQKIVLAIFLVAALWVHAQEVVKLQSEKYNDYALNYYLPQTVVDVEVVATKTYSKPGPYYQYAKKYLGTTDVITVEDDKWEIHSVNVVPRGVANTNNRYQLAFKSKQTPFIFVSPEHTILSVNTEPYPVERDTTDYLPQAINSDIDMTQAMTEEMLMSGSVAKMAELAAKQIYRIRESRMNILTGEADNMPADGESLRIIMEQLDRQEKALTALFVGTKQVEVHSKVVTFTPEDDVENVILMRFSDHLGFVDVNNLSGAPLYITVEVVKRGEYPVDNNGVVKMAPKGALTYNIPGEAVVCVTYDGDEMSRESIQVAQLGVVYGLDPGLITAKKEPTYIIFNPYTGGIEEMGIIVEE